ncbi:MAG: hypothetical protein ACRD2T_12765 [Thermoanaerobaculia bacterium]
MREGKLYFILFLVAGALFAGAAVLFFLENADKNALRQALADAKSKSVDLENQAKKARQDLEDLRGMVGGEANKQLGAALDDAIKQKREEAQTFLNGLFTKYDKIAPKSFNDLLTPYDEYKNYLTKVINTRELAVEQQKRHMEDLNTTKKSAADEVKKKDETVAQLNTQIRDTEAKYEKRVSELTADGERLQKELATAKDQLATLEIAKKRGEDACQSRIATLLLRLEQCMEESRKTRGIEDVDPDGRILQVVGTSQIGWIDIGRKQHLKPGIQFQVFQNIKGGKRQVKGRLEVRRVDESTSEFRIIETLDELNPIIQGDYITSPFYDPKAVPVFVIAGEGLESKDVTEDQLRSKIKSYGASINYKVDLKTSFLIALKGYEKSPLYKDARELGVAVVREREILEYMGF